MEATAIQHTKKWINEVVIGCNFCPFAAKEVRQDKVRYTLVDDETAEKILAVMIEECRTLDSTDAIETTLIVLTNCFEDFNEYLDLVGIAEKALKQNEYEGIYQVASFHPGYCFAGADENDAANYTNRSPYPMLHLLREESIEKALERFPDPETIPEKNIDFARSKGLAFMQALKEACLK